MDALLRIAALLEHPSAERRVAAAIVLGELQAKDHGVVSALLATLDRADVSVRVPVIEALGKIAPKAAVQKLLDATQSEAAVVRDAAVVALRAYGEAIVSDVKKRLSGAGADGRRALEAVLAGLGSKEAFTTLLDNLLEAPSADAAKAIALNARASIKNAERDDKGRYLAALDKFAARKDVRTNAGALLAALKLAGFLEDERAEALLIAHAEDKKLPDGVRQEALLSLRFIVQKVKKQQAIVETLLELGEKDSLVVARAALETLALVSVPEALLARLRKLTQHKDAERARIAVLELAKMPGLKALEAAVEVLTSAERARAELVAQAIAGRAEEAMGLLARAMLSINDADRAWLVQKLIRPHAQKLDKKTAKALLGKAMDAIKSGDQGFEAALALARLADAEATAEALRDVAEALSKGKTKERALNVFRLLAKSEHATDEDRYVLATLELSGSKRDVHPSARAQDAALRLFERLSERGYDLEQALLKDRRIDLESKFYLGFHFSELRRPVGAALLEAVVAKAGKTKLGKIAKNRLALVSD
ncbi:MAG: HEAT repeat domain-containing protein [Deltaproteobacteria bacterium]|nr:HEAT repeat domain-containing protein [Deltaproteobacteria bacterium]